MLGRGVAAQRGGARNSLARWRKQIADADVAFCNLECAVSNRGAKRNLQLLAIPDSLRQLQGFDVVSTANNHALDDGAAGAALGLKILQQAHIAAIGSRLGGGAWHGWRTTVRGRRVAWLAASAWGPFQKGRAEVRPLAGSGLLEEVAALSKAGDLVFVSLHWGLEYEARPTDGQRRTAHALIDAGASAVIGHHPHVAQPVESYRGRPIFYSLGNFLFDRTPRAQSGLVARISFDAARHVTWTTTDVNAVPAVVGEVRAETEMARIGGHFLRGEKGPQILVWTRLADGTHRLQLKVLRADGWTVVDEGHHASIYDLQRGDVDGDGLDEILLGLNQRSKLDVVVRKRLHVYNASLWRGFRPKWRGSKLSRPFQGFTLLPAAKGYDLVALETNPLPAYRGFDWVSVYRWNGFGFRLLWDTPVRGKVLKLRTGRDTESAFIRLEQSAPDLNRTLTLRPTSGAETGFKAAVTMP